MLQIRHYVRVEADPLEVYDDPRQVRAPDGRSYLVRVLPAGFGSSPLVPGGFQLGALMFAFGWVLGRAWRVEVRDDEGTSGPDGWSSAPVIATAARTRSKRAAAAEAHKVVDLIAQRGWATASRKPWPKVGFVTILGAESQEAVFVPRELTDRHLEPGSLLLRLEGGQQWLSQAEAGRLRSELTLIAERAGPDVDAHSVADAIELVDYETGERSGVAVVPPAELPAP